MQNHELEIIEIDKNENAKPIIEEGQLALDIYETKEAFIVLAPIAGLDRKEIEIMINEDVLVIKGERNYPKNIKEKDFLVKECYFGPFSRSILLPREADLKNVKAKFEKNILEITISKDKENGPTHIEIE